MVSPDLSVEAFFPSPPSSGEDGMQAAYHLRVPPVIGVKVIAPDRLSVTTTWHVQDSIGDRAAVQRRAIQLFDEAKARMEKKLPHDHGRD